MQFVCEAQWGPMSMSRKVWSLFGMLLLSIIGSSKCSAAEAVEMIDEGGVVVMTAMAAASRNKMGRIAMMLVRK